MGLDFCHGGGDLQPCRLQNVECLNTFATVMAYLSCPLPTRPEMCRRSSWCVCVCGRGCTHPDHGAHEHSEKLALLSRTANTHGTTVYHNALSAEVVGVPHDAGPSTSEMEPVVKAPRAFSTCATQTSPRWHEVALNHAALELPLPQQLATGTPQRPERSRLPLPQQLAPVTSQRLRETAAAATAGQRGAATPLVQQTGVPEQRKGAERGGCVAGG